MAKIDIEQVNKRIKIHQDTIIKKLPLELHKEFLGLKWKLDYRDLPLLDLSNASPELASTIKKEFPGMKTFLK